MSEKDSSEATDNTTAMSEDPTANTNEEAFDEGKEKSEAEGSHQEENGDEEEEKKQQGDEEDAPVLAAENEEEPERFEEMSPQKLNAGSSKENIKNSGETKAEEQQQNDQAETKAKFETDTPTKTDTQLGVVEGQEDFPHSPTVAAPACSPPPPPATPPAAVDAGSHSNPEPEKQAGLEHSFYPGDHVIRWEMLPIVWPIQIHGIVLEVGKNYVEICDFGLTAQDRPDAVQPAAEAAAPEGAADALTKQEARKKKFADAWNKVKPKDHSQKQRITVHIITEQDELKKWSKVHYGRNLLGFGAGPDKNAAGNDGDHQQDDSHTAGSPTDQNIPNNNSQDDTSPKKQPVRNMWNKFRNWKEERKTARGSKDKDMDQMADTSPEEFAAAVAAANSTDANGYSEDYVGTTKKPKNDKKKGVLPKSDPPKLVLARTRFLLEHGENIMPPYHVFASNSECIAVFCKTGHWRTLQASVFLHSTAIGNAKSSMAMTLGVAASMPLLAPAIAGLGLVAVGAPYMILNQSKGKWQEATTNLTEAFWQQAPNEVFVECIEHWSHLGDENLNADEDQSERPEEFFTDLDANFREQQTHPMTDALMTDESICENALSRQESIESQLSEAGGTEADGAGGDGADLEKKPSNDSSRAIVFSV